MLVVIWTVAVVLAVFLYFYNTLTKYHNRGVKTESTWTVMASIFKVFMGWEHLSEAIRRNYNKYERFVCVYMRGIPNLQVQDLELIKKIAVKDFEHFIDHSNISAGDPLFSRNLFTLKGDEWRNMRSNLSPAFTSSKMKQMLPFMVEVGDQMMLNLKKEIKESGSDTMEINVKDLTTRYANDVIASCAFGVKVNSHRDRNNEFYIRGMDATTLTSGLILKTMLYVAAPLIVKLLRLKFFSEKSRVFFTNLVLSTMRNRDEKDIIRPDMIHLLMLAKKGNLVHEESQEADAGFATVEESTVGKGKISQEWTDIDLVAQALIFFFAGFDTVSTAMSFLLYELAVNPDVQEKLYNEIHETHAKNGGKFDYNSIQQMPYLDMVVSETLRKWPPAVSLDRVCVKDYNMGKPNANSTEDYIMRKGEGLQIPVWGIQRDPDYFPNPLKFDPERFSEENRRNILPFTYSPFGLGPRNCIGSRFALSEVKVMVYQLLQHMEVSPGPQTVITNELEANKFTVGIKGGHWLNFKLRG